MLRHIYTRPLVLILIVGLLLVGCGPAGAPATSEPTSPQPPPTEAAAHTPTVEAATSAPTAETPEEMPDLTGQTLTIVTFGGGFLDAFRAAALDPFEQETGVEIVVDDTCCQKQTSLLMSGAEYVGDLLFGSDFQEGEFWGKEGILIEQPEFLNLEEQYSMPEELRSSFALPVYQYGIIMAAASGVTEIPQTWEEFFDTERFPGPRALEGYQPTNMLPVALLSEGVPYEDLYPLDEERAFDILENLQSETKVFYWETGVQSIQLLSSGEVTYGAVYSNRLYQAIKSGVDLGYNFNDGLKLSSAAMVLRGSKNPEAALAFLRYALRPEVQEAFSTGTGLGPINMAAFDKMAPEDQALMVTSEQNTARMHYVSGEWWRDNIQRLLPVWQQFIAQ